MLMVAKMKKGILSCPLFLPYYNSRISIKKYVNRLYSFSKNLAQSEIIGAIMPPIRPLVEHNPTIALLEEVGKSSEVYENRVAVTQAANSLAISDETVLMQAISYNKRKFEILLIHK
jgi:hypothetical protein